MKSKSFLESDFLSNKRVLVFGINRLQSTPTFAQIKAIDQHYQTFRGCGFDEVCCITFVDFPLFEQMMEHMSRQILFVQDQDIVGFKQLLGKVGNPKFLQDHWQFVCVLNNKQVELYKEQQFNPRHKDPDTLQNIYDMVQPSEVLKLL